MKLAALAATLTAIAVADAAPVAANDSAYWVAGRSIAMGETMQQSKPACVQCHGLDGRGHGGIPALAGQGSWYLYKALRDYASGRRESAAMQQFARALSDQDAQNVARYYASLPPFAPDLQREASASRGVHRSGGTIVAVGLPEQGVPACSSCHGANGTGMPPVYPRIAGQDEAYLVDQMLSWKQGRRGGDPLDVMRIIAQAMSEEQIADVSAYLAASGRTAPQSKSQAAEQRTNAAGQSTNAWHGSGVR